MSNVASADDGVVRVRVADYERLLANMLAEAESRVSAAEAETSCARDEADALRAELDRALARESESARTYETWRDALVETAADELAAEASRWRDAMDARDDIVESTRRDADAAAAAAERREARHADLIRACIAEYPETAAFWVTRRRREGTSPVELTRRRKRASNPPPPPRRARRPRPSAERRHRSKHPRVNPRVDHDTVERDPCRSRRRWRRRRPQQRQSRKLRRRLRGEWRMRRRGRDGERQRRRRRMGERPPRGCGRSDRSEGV